MEKEKEKLAFIAWAMGELGLDLGSLKESNEVDNWATSRASMSCYKDENTIDLWGWAGGKAVKLPDQLVGDSYEGSGEGLSFLHSEMSLKEVEGIASMSFILAKEYRKTTGYNPGSGEEWNNESVEFTLYKNPYYR